MTTVLAAVLALSVGFVVGLLVRPQPRRVWACARCDDEALMTSERARFDDLIASLDLTNHEPEGPA
ncbi:hypothetical protein ACFYO0_14455 [Streptomyces sp. NPDC006365]|uniref:hypothetical protein n=1 Tax=Streptomyces sp. NPDC006365 TaxID=3364744 RepID=UPI0036B2C8C5